MKKIFFSFLLFLYVLNSGLAFANLGENIRAAQTGNERVRANKKFAAKMHAAKHDKNNHFIRNGKHMHRYKNGYSASSSLPNKQDNETENEVNSLPNANEVKSEATPLPNGGEQK